MILFLLMVLGVAWIATTHAERVRFGKSVVGAIPVKELRQVAEQIRPEHEAYVQALRSRTPWIAVTPAIVALYITIYLGMVFGAGAVSDPETQLRWGASFGPSTTNGEWWRLLGATFVHAGFFHLIFDLVGLVQIAFVLERLVGRLAVASVYVAAGVFGSLVSLSEDPIAVYTGGSAAIFGLYGLFAVATTVGLLQKGPLTMPVATAIRLVPAPGLYLLYNLAGGGSGTGAEIAGLFAGLSCGLAMAKGLTDHKPPLTRGAAVMGAAAAIAFVFAVPLRGVADVRPELARVVELESQMAGHYEYALARFRKEQLPADKLIELIEKTIRPELQRAQARIKALEGVPSEHEAMVAAAARYLSLRDESYRLRADGLANKNMISLRDAERRERAALEALATIKPSDEPAEVPAAGDAAEGK
jgi:membrane associated rhomboid family serine protease